MTLSCDMQLDRPNGQYQAGETVIGNIYLTLPERQLIKAIALEANGYAACSWLKPQKQKKKNQQPQEQNVVVIDKSKEKQKEPIAFEQRVDYLASTSYFIGSEAARHKIMDAGVYHFAFSVPLPENCPSSYEGQYGHIRYTLQLVLLLGGDTNERLVAHYRTLQVVQHADLRHESATLNEPLDEQQLERTPRMKFWQRPLLLELNIPRRGYAPGEGISVHVRLHNPQQLMLSELIYKLNLLTTYTGQQRGKPKRQDTKLERRNLLSSVHQLSNTPRGELFQHLHTLTVPQMPPSLEVVSCQCLQLSYEVEVVAKTTQRTRFIMAQVPVVIGSMREGLSINMHSASVANLAVTRSMDDLNAATAPALTPTATNLTTPNFSVSMHSLASTFREADFMTANNPNKGIKHAMSGESLDFKPRYLYYEMEHAEGEKML